MHGGEPIVSGTRFILAVFAYIAGADVGRAACAAAAAHSMATPSDHDYQHAEPSESSKRQRTDEIPSLSKVNWTTAKDDQGSSEQSIFKFSF